MGLGVEIEIVGRSIQPLLGSAARAGDQLAPGRLVREISIYGLTEGTGVHIHSFCGGVCMPNSACRSTRSLIGYRPE